MTVKYFQRNPYLTRKFNTFVRYLRKMELNRNLNQQTKYQHLHQKSWTL